MESCSNKSMGNDQFEYIDDSDEESKLLKIEASSSGLFPIHRILDGTMYAGSNTQEEKIELERNMRALLEIPDLPFSFIEKHFLAYGYNGDLIRQIYTALTGITPNDSELLTKYFSEVPETIPGVNYGWGPSKDKEYEYYFILPFLYHWCVFGQRGVTKRDIVGKFDSLSKAIEAIKQKVSTFYSRETLTEPKKVEKDSVTLPNVTEEDLGIKASLVESLRYMSPESRTQLLDKLIEHDIISEQGKNQILKKFAEERTQTELPSEQVKSREVFHKTKPETFEELLSTTPETDRDKKTVFTISDIIASIEEDFENLERETGYKFIIQKWLYTKEEHSRKLVTNLPVSGQDVLEFFGGGSNVLVKAQVISPLLPKTAARSVYVVYRVSEKEIFRPDTFKGEDNQIYALSKDGLDSYFEPLLQAKTV